MPAARRLRRRPRRRAGGRCWASRRNSARSTRRSTRSLDTWYLGIELFVAWTRWPERALRWTAAALFAWRFAGVVLFELTAVRPLLLVFPNLFENFYLYVTICRKWVAEAPPASRDDPPGGARRPAAAEARPGVAAPLRAVPSVAVAQVDVRLTPRRGGYAGPMTDQPRTPAIEALETAGIPFRVVRTEIARSAEESAAFQGIPVGLAPAQHPRASRPGRLPVRPRPRRPPVQLAEAPPAAGHQPPDAADRGGGEGRDGLRPGRDHPVRRPPAVAGHRRREHRWRSSSSRSAAARGA